MKSKSSFLLMAATAVGLVNASPAMADLIGTSVSGVLQFNGGGPNFFDQANGFVPAGFGNSAPNSPNNVVIGSGTEFGFADGANTDTANFTGSQLILTDISGPGQAPAVFTFSNTAFAGAAISLQSSNFPVTITETLVGNVLTLSTPVYNTGGTFVATFNITPAAVP